MVKVWSSVRDAGTDCIIIVSQSVSIVSGMKFFTALFWRPLKSYWDGLKEFCVFSCVYVGVFASADGDVFLAFLPDNCVFLQRFWSFPAINDIIVRFPNNSSHYDCDFQGLRNVMLSVNVRFVLCAVENGPYNNLEMGERKNNWIETKMKYDWYNYRRNNAALNKWSFLYCSNI